VGFQLTLGIKLSTKSTLENFVRGANEELLNSLEGLLAGRESTWIHLWGPEGLLTMYFLKNIPLMF
jgi:hypothetical protein